MNLSFLATKFFSKDVVNKYMRHQIAEKPSAFRTWLRMQGNKYIYGVVPEPERLLVKNGNYELNRLILKIYISDKSPEELQRTALRRSSQYLFSRKPDLVITDFRIDEYPLEIELKHSDDFFLDAYYASEEAEIFENKLPGYIKEGSVRDRLRLVG